MNNNKNKNYQKHLKKFKLNKLLNNLNFYI